MIPQTTNEWGCAIGLMVIVAMLFTALWGTLTDKTPGCDDIYE